MVPCFISFVNSHFTIIHMSLSANSLSASVYCFIYPTLNKFYLSIYLSSGFVVFTGTPWGLSSRSDFSSSTPRMAE